MSRDPLQHDGHYIQAKTDLWQQDGHYTQVKADLWQHDGHYIQAKRCHVIAGNMMDIELKPRDSTYSAT